jgi:CheY-like chemotaxis protein
MKPKVLIIEDEPYRQKWWKEDLESKVEVLSALTIQQAEELFAGNPDVALIVMDACLSGRSPDTILLVKKIRQTFSGPMIAASGNPEYRELLCEAGCDHSCEKYKVPKKVLEILAL